MRGFVWLDGKLVPASKAVISVQAHALHYGTAAFEGLRFYQAAHQGSRKKARVIFRLNDHLKRLYYSAGQLGMRPPIAQTELRKALIKTVRAHTYEEGYIRPIFFYGADSLGIDTSRVRVHAAILVLPWGKYLPKQSIAVLTSRIRRFSPRAFDPRAKIAGPYVNSVTAHLEAKKRRYDEALLLDERDFVAEGSGENVFMVKCGALSTPKCGNILPGITRDTVIKIARAGGFTVREKDIKLAELKKADEVFFTGTAAEVTPIYKVDTKKIGRGGVGAVTELLKTTFERVIRGRERRYGKWLTYL